VIQVISEKNNEVVYTLRIKGSEFTPVVYNEGTYTVEAGEGNNKKVFTGLKSKNRKGSKSIVIEL